MNSTGRARLLCAFAAVHTLTMSLSAQEVELVSGEVSCADCVITLDTVVTIGGLDGPGLSEVTQFAHIAVDRRGRILITSSELEIAVFGSNGEFLRTVGRRGEGPGEYRSISHIGVGERYIHVFDHQAGRTMLDHDFRVVRTDRFPGQVHSGAVLGNDDVAFTVPASGPVGHKLYVLGPSGQFQAHGDDGREHPPTMTEWVSQQSTVTGGGETVWAVRYDSNRIVRWDLGRETRVGKILDRHIVEFGDGEPRERSGSGSMNNAVMADDQGLWINWHSPDPDWTEPEGSGNEMPSEPMREVVDGWLDLVDPETGRTIARRRFDGAFPGFAENSRYLVAYHETDAGVPFLYFLEPRLSRR